MAIARLTSQDAQGFSTASSSVLAIYAATPTANNLLVAIIGDTDGTNNATAISGWTQDALGNVSTTTEIKVFHKVANGSESKTVTATTGAAISANMAIYEYTGLATTSPFDQSANGGGLIGSTTWSTGTTPTTTVSNELAVVGMDTLAQETFVSWSNGFSVRSSVTSGVGHELFTGDQIVSAKAAYNSTLTISGVTGGSTVIATFKGASSVSNLTILGAG